MNRGYVKLWRKSLSSGLLQNHGLWVFWTYCLMKATHKSITVIIGNQQIALNPGQFIFGRRIAAEETALTERKIRTCLALLIKWQNLTIKTTNKFSIITIVNWDIYQGREDENDQVNDQDSTSTRPHTRTKEQEKKENPPDFSSLRKRYSDQNLLDQVFAAIASTRKAGKVSDSILISQLRKWERFPPGQVEAGIRTYLQKGYASQGKREEYLLGIIRNHDNGKPTTRQQTTGSPLLDSYYARNGN